MFSNYTYKRKKKQNTQKESNFSPTCASLTSAYQLLPTIPSLGPPQSARSQKSRNDFPVFREDLIHELVGKKGNREG